MALVWGRKKETQINKSFFCDKLKIIDNKCNILTFFIALQDNKNHGKDFVFLQIKLAMF